MATKYSIQDVIDAIARLRRRVHWDKAIYHDCFGTGRLFGETDDGFEIEASVDYAFPYCSVRFLIRDSDSDAYIVFFSAKGIGAHWSGAFWECASWEPDQPTFEKAVVNILWFCRDVNAAEEAKQRALETNARNRFFR